MPNFTAGTSFTDGVTNDVTAAKLNALVADAVPTSSLALASTTGTISNFTSSTANITLGTIPTLTAGTTTGTAGIFTSGTITTALIPTGTFGTTTSTAATITTGTIPTLTAGTTTSTAATITNGTITTALIPTLTAGTTTGTTGIFTSGTVTTLNSTTGTIGNLSTTLAGDFTISQGTGTIGTTGATLGTYGGSTSVPVLAINAKGQVTSTGTAAITSGLTGFRNRIINGDMRIDARNAGAVHTPIANTYSIDRWNFQLAQASKLTAQRKTVTNPQQADNNTYLLNITSTSAYSVTSSDYFLLGQFIEGFNSADLGWGTSGAKSITISFWVYSSLTGTFGGSVQNSAIARSYPFSYTISSASTWEKKTITIAGDTSGTWVTDNGLGIRLYFGLGAGSTVSGTAGSWASANYLSATGAVSVVGTNGATFDITGVQLEAGSTATDFERRPIGTELALCQRYYQKRISDAYATGVVGQAYSTAAAYGSVSFTQEMRASPNIGLASTGSALNTISFMSSAATHPATIGTIVAANIGVNGFQLTATGYTSGFTAGNASVLYRYGSGEVWNASAEL